MMAPCCTDVAPWCRNFSRTYSTSDLLYVTLTLRHTYSTSHLLYVTLALRHTCSASHLAAANYLCVHRMCSLTIECVVLKVECGLLHENVFSYYSQKRATSCCKHWTQASRRSSRASAPSLCSLPPRSVFVFLFYTFLHIYAVCTLMYIHTHCTHTLASPHTTHMLHYRR